jgi:hypothetical protein
MKLEFSRQISEYPQISNVMKILLVGAELYHAGGWLDGQRDRQTGITKLSPSVEDPTIPKTAGRILSFL